MRYLLNPAQFLSIDHVFRLNHNEISSVWNIGQVELANIKGFGRLFEYDAPLQTHHGDSFQSFGCLDMNKVSVRWVRINPEAACLIFSEAYRWEATDFGNPPRFVH